MMSTGRRWLWLPTLLGLTAGQAHAVPIEGDLGGHAAALLVLLGVAALVRGVCNLRELRHQRLVPRGQPHHASDGEFGAQAGLRRPLG